VRPLHHAAGLSRPRPLFRPGQRDPASAPAAYSFLV
jgi:hypothetical protein